MLVTTDSVANHKKSLFHRIEVCAGFDDIKGALEYRYDIQPIRGLVRLGGERGEDCQYLDLQLLVGIAYQQVVQVIEEFI